MSNGSNFGEVAGIKPGTLFATRRQLHEADIHRPLQAGIAGSQRTGAESIVLSGGYEDDHDDGDEIIYTGHGGRDPDSGIQIADQELTRQNLALAKSHLEGLPVRVVRGAGNHSPYAPDNGYRYDGLYFIDSYWSERGKSGFRVWRFRLIRADRSEHIAKVNLPLEPSTSPERRETTVQRVVRSSRIAQRVKEIHNYRCQVCDTRLKTPAGPYAEAAHVRPLGRPHDGADVSSNILCLCPNHHVLFDTGGLLIFDDLVVRNAQTGEIVGRLRTEEQHRLDSDYIAYHRSLH